MLTFLIILGILLLINILLFIFSRNKVEDANAPKHRKVNYEEEVKRVRTSTTPQVQDI